ncbi:BapA/Bap/LapF family prefix-like domain-containing protein, partial [Acinetobacter schindleri]
MASIDILAKNNGQIIQSLNTDSVILNQNSVVKIGVKIEDVANILREGNAAVITLKSGEKIVVENYFDPAVNESLLVFEGNNGELYWAEFTDSSGQLLVKYNPITEEALLGGGATDLLPWIGGALAVGGIAAAVGGSGGSSSGGNIDRIPPNAPEVISFDGITIQGTAEPGSTIQIKNEDGEVLGSVIVDNNGNYTIELNPPLSNGEEIKVTATDKSNNTSIETVVNAPDTTAPLLPVIEGFDGTTVVGTAEPGS